MRQQQASACIRERATPEEWEQRVALAAAYRLVAHFRWDDLIFTHLTARVPGSDHHFLINPYGMTFDEITASNLVKVDLDGKKVMDSPYEINPAGFTIHSAIHAAREDAHCSAIFGSCSVPLSLPPPPSPTDPCTQALQNGLGSFF